MDANWLDQLLASHSDDQAGNAALANAIALRKAGINQAGGVVGSEMPVTSAALPPPGQPNEAALSARISARGAPTRGDGRPVVNRGISGTPAQSPGVPQNKPTPSMDLTGEQKQTTAPGYDAALASQGINKPTRKPMQVPPSSTPMTAKPKQAGIFSDASSQIEGVGKAISSRANPIIQMLMQRLQAQQNPLANR